ncbi:MAG: NnrU family protein [Alphaproteobacteria bacterium]
MTNLIIASALFFLIHSLVSGTGLRFVLIDKIGQGAYLGIFSLISIGSVVWMSMAYGDAPYIHIPVLGDLPPAIDYVTLVIMIAAFLLAVVGITTKNPTATGQEAMLQGDDVAHGIVRITRHPFLFGAALWAFAHILSNGEVASLIFFGTFFVVVVRGMINIDRKRARVDPAGWEKFAAQTSRVPFLAIMQGRNSLKLGELGAVRVLGAIVIFVAIFYFHAELFGAAAGSWVTGAPGLG